MLLFLRVFRYSYLQDVNTMMEVVGIALKCVIGVSVSKPHTSEQCGKKFFVSYVHMYVHSGTCSNYAEVTSSSYFASSCVIR